MMALALNVYWDSSSLQWNSCIHLLGLMLIPHLKLSSCKHLVESSSLQISSGTHINIWRTQITPDIKWNTCLFEFKLTPALKWNSCKHLLEINLTPYLKRNSFKLLWGLQFTLDLKWNSCRLLWGLKFTAALMWNSCKQFIVKDVGKMVVSVYRIRKFTCLIYLWKGQIKLKNGVLLQYGAVLGNYVFSSVTRTGPLWVAHYFPRYITFPAESYPKPH